MKIQISESRSELIIEDVSGYIPQEPFQPFEVVSLKDFEGDDRYFCENVKPGDTVEAVFMPNGALYLQYPKTDIVFCDDARLNRDFSLPAEIPLIRFYAVDAEAQLAAIQIGFNLHRIGLMYEQLRLRGVKNIGISAEDKSLADPIEQHILNLRGSNIERVDRVVFEG